MGIQINSDTIVEETWAIFGENSYINCFGKDIRIKKLDDGSYIIKYFYAIYKTIEKDNKPFVDSRSISTPNIDNVFTTIYDDLKTVFPDSIDV